MRNGRTTALILLALYVVSLAVIAFWPEPIDKGTGPFFRRLHELVPFITHARVEIAANVVLFVPFGALLAIALERARYLVLPIVFLASATIEAAQALLPLRTTSYVDILANTAGGCLGLVVVAIVRASREYSRRARSTEPGRR